MFVKLLLFSIGIVSLCMLVLGIRLLFDKKAELKSSCQGVGCGCQLEENKSCDHS